MWQTGRYKKKMPRGVSSKNICERASERRNENKIVSGTLKIYKLHADIMRWYKILKNINLLFELIL